MNLNKKKIAVCVLISLLIVSAVGISVLYYPESIANLFTSDVDTYDGQKTTGSVYENQYGRLEVYPEVSTGIIRQEQECLLTSFIDDCEIDLTFRFDIQIANPDIWMWRNISHMVQVPVYGMVEHYFILYNISSIEVIDEPEYVDYGDIPSDYYRRGTASFRIDNEDDTYEWIEGVFDIGFDSFEWLNPEHTSAKFYYEYYGVTGYVWEEQYWFDWDSIKDKFSHVEHNGKHYYYVRSWMIKDQEYRFKWQYDILLGSSGKWDLLAKKSSDPLGTWRVSIDPWWDSDWDYYQTITISPTYIDSNLVNFPVLVAIPDATGDKCQANGEDIVFTLTDNATVLAHEIEKWVDNADRIVWVNVTSISSSVDTKINMYYGNAEASDSQDVEAVWDSDYIMVQHMDGANAGACVDSTINNNDVTGSGGTPDYQQTGQIGYGINFESDDSEWVSISDSVSLDIGSYDITMQCWVKPDGATADTEGYIAKWDTGANKRAYLLSARGVDELTVYVTDNGGWSSGHRSYAVSGDDVLTHDSWQHISGYYTDANEDPYMRKNTSDITGVVGEHTATGIVNTDRPLYIASQESSGAPYRFGDGIIDEVRISSIVRSVPWLNTDFHTMNQTIGFMMFGSEQSALPSWSNSDPVNSNPDPQNSNTSVSITPTLRIQVNDVDMHNQSVNTTWWSNSSGSWIPFATNTSSVNTTFYQVFDNATATLTTYYWSANTSDGNGGWDNDTFSFTTRGWDYSQLLAWKIINETGVTILKLSTSGNLAIAGLLFENTNSPPAYANIVFSMNNTFWLDMNGTLYIKDRFFYIVDTETIYVCDDVDAQGYEGGDTDGAFAGSENEFTSGDYNNIKVDDNNYVLDSWTTNNEYQYHRFVFSIAENVADITQIDITWKGYGYNDNPPPGYGHSLWVKETGGWSEKDSGTSSSKETLTMQKTGSFSDWINGGVLECGVQSDKSAISLFGVDSLLRSYYLEVKITYLGGHIGGR